MKHTKEQEAAADRITDEWYKKVKTQLSRELAIMELGITSFLANGMSYEEAKQKVVEIMTTSYKKVGFTEDYLLDLLNFVKKQDARRQN